MHENIFAPWRFKYVTSHSAPSDCVLCKARDASDDDNIFILHRGTRCFIILNLYPYNNGHIMIVPNEHTSFLNDLDQESSNEMFRLASRCEEILKKVYSPQGFNIGMNIGKCAGAGIEDHIHLHVIPRWQGDTSFMSVVSGTRVIPEDIESTFKKLKPLFQ